MPSCPNPCLINYITLEFFSPSLPPSWDSDSARLARDNSWLFYFVRSTIGRGFPFTSCLDRLAFLCRWCVPPSIFTRRIAEAVRCPRPLLWASPAPKALVFNNSKDTFFQFLFPCSRGTDLDHHELYILGSSIYWSWSQFEIGLSVMTL